MKNAAVIAVVLVLLVLFFSWLSRRSRNAPGADPLAHKNIAADGGVPNAGLGGQDTGGYGNL
jgi:hypothetical protein